MREGLIAEISIPVMKELLEAKYQQVVEFQETIAASNSAFLMETTNDTFWGVGMMWSAM